MKGVFINLDILTGGRHGTPDLASLLTFKEYIQENNIPVGLVTSRNVAFLEAYIQLLGLRSSEFPSIAEGGAIIYWPNQSDNQPWEFTIKDTNFRHKRRRIINSLSRNSVTYEAGKTASLTLYPNTSSPSDLFERLVNSNSTRGCEVSLTNDGVDITPKNVHRFAAVERVCEMLNISLDEIIYVGNDVSDTIPLEDITNSGVTLNYSGNGAYSASKEGADGVIEIIEDITMNDVPTEVTN